MSTGTDCNISAIAVVSVLGDAGVVNILKNLADALNALSPKSRPEP